MGTSASRGDAARERAQRAGSRALELGERRQRLRDGLLSTDADVERARAAASESRWSNVLAQQRNARSHRDAAAAHRSAAAVAERAGHPEQAADHRSAAVLDEAAAVSQDVAAQRAEVDARALERRVVARGAT